MNEENHTVYPKEKKQAQTLAETWNISRRWTVEGGDNTGGKVAGPREDQNLRGQYAKPQEPGR